MALHGKEKIWFLVNRLEDEREITLEDEPVALHPMQDLNHHYLPLDLIKLSKKLEAENAAKLLNQAPTDQTEGKYLFKLLPGFDKYLDKLLDDPEYLEWSGKKPKPKAGVRFGDTIDFSKSREQNKDKYISVGQIEEFEKMPEAEQQRIKKESLTEKHIKDIEDYKKSSLEFFNNIKKNFKIPDRAIPQLADVSFALPPNYEAEQVGLLRQLVKQQETSKALAQERALAVTYTSSRQVLLNDMFQLAKPNFDSENDLVFGFLYKNPNKTFSKKNIEQELKTSITKDFHKIVENLGFKGDLAKIFFSTSKNSIMFRNPVSSNELEQMGITIVRLK